jgi:exopolysaccharide biosynthesis predicted pyruvyltransferase EpsI
MIFDEHAEAEQVGEAGAAPDLAAVCPAQHFTSREFPNQTVERMPWSAVTSRLHSIILAALPGIAHLCVR